MKKMKKFDNFDTIVENWHRGQVVSEPCPIIPPDPRGHTQLIELEVVPVESEGGWFSNDPSEKLYELMDSMFKSQNPITP